MRFQYFNATAGLGHTHLPRRPAFGPVRFAYRRHNHSRAIAGPSIRQCLTQLPHRLHRDRERAHGSRMCAEVDSHVRTRPGGISEHVVVRHAALSHLQTLNDGVAAVVTHDQDELLA